jgi:hypothetical protein
VALTRYTIPPFRESISWIISPSKCYTATVFLHAHLQVVYYNCVKFHKNSISSLVGVALTRYMPPPPFREGISWIISPFKFWTAIIFFHENLQVVYYKCVKFHKYPISGWGGVALTRYMDGLTDGRTNRVIPIYPPNFVCGGYNKPQRKPYGQCRIYLGLTGWCLGPQNLGGLWSMCMVF